MGSSYDRIGIEYQNAYGFNEGVHKAIQWLLDKLPVNSSILDIGSGTGLTAKFFSEAGHDVLGIDNSNIMNKIARKQAPKARFVEMNFKRLRLGEQAFDAIVAFFSLLHVQKSIYERVLQTILEHLKPGGYFLLAQLEGNIDGEEFYMGQKLYFSSYPREELTEILQKHGLEIIKDYSVEFRPKLPNAELEQHLFYYTQKNSEI